MAKDLFSQQASLYARYRPAYPPELYDHVLSFVHTPAAVWDCATGNGQAAVALAGFFERVYATDHSEKQLLQAIPHEKVSYSVAAAEQTSFPDHSFDLITVAQAYHWFDFDAFHREVLRVAKPGAVIAVWGYSLIQSEDSALQELITSFYRGKTGPYWDAERRFVDDHYSTVAFPYEALPSRDFRIDVEWSADDLIGYFNTWSSVQHFIKANGYNPVDELALAIKMIWSDASLKLFYFPLFLKIGMI